MLNNKWGGGAFIIYQGVIYPPFKLVGFSYTGSEYSYNSITEYEVDMRYISTLLNVRLIPEYDEDEVKYNPVDNILPLWIPDHVLEATPEVPQLQVIVNGRVVNKYNGISINNIISGYRYFHDYNIGRDPLTLTIDPNLVEDDHIVLQFLVHGDD